MTLSSGQTSKKFKLWGEAIFEAEDLDDAFRLLAIHFINVSFGKESNLFLPQTDIHLEVIKNDNIQ